MILIVDPAGLNVAVAASCLDHALDAFANIITIANLCTYLLPTRNITIILLEPVYIG